MAEINEIFPAGEAEKIKQVGVAINEVDKSLIGLSANLTKIAELVNQSGISFDNLSKAQKETTKNTKEIDTVGKQLQATETKLKELDDERQVQIMKNKDEIQKRTKALKEEADQNKITANSIAALRKENAELTKARNNVNTSTEEGKKKIKELNAQIDANNKIIKNNSDSLLKQKLNIGNYASALDGVAPGLSAMRTGIINATTAARAFIATPIGLILAALAAVIGIVSAAFKRIQPLMDWFNIVIAQATAVLDVIIDRVAKFGQGLINMLKGNVKEGLGQMGDAFKGVGEQIANATAAAKEHELIMQRLLKTEGQYKITLAGNNNELEKQRARMKDLTLSFKERKAAADEVVRIEKENLELTKQRAKEALIADIMNAGGSKGRADAEALLSNAIENNVALTNEQIGATLTNDEAAKDLNNRIAEYIALEGESTRKLGEVMGQRSSFINQLAAEERRLHEEKLARMEAERKAQEELFKASQETSVKENEAREADFAKQIEDEEAKDEALLTQSIDAAIAQGEAVNIRKQNNEEVAKSAKEKADIETFAAQESSLAATENARTIQDASKSVLNTIRRAVKARLAEAMATQIQKVITKIPFPFNIAAAAAAGAALNLLFNKIVPQFATGTDDAPAEFIAGEAGREMLHLKSGEVIMANKATHFKGNKFKGAKIYTNKQTEAILQGGNTYNNMIDVSLLSADIKSVRDAIENKPVMIVDQSGTPIGYTQRNYTKKYVNKLKYGN